MRQLWSLAGFAVFSVVMGLVALALRKDWSLVASLDLGHRRRLEVRFDEFSEVNLRFIAEFRGTRLGFSGRSTRRRETRRRFS